MSALLNDLLWIISEVFYYSGLLLAVFFIPALLAVFWGLNLMDKAGTDYMYLLSGWMVLLLMVIAGIVIKNFLYNRLNS